MLDRETELIAELSRIKALELLGKVEKLDAESPSFVGCAANYSELGMREFIRSFVASFGLKYKIYFTDEQVDRLAAAMRVAFRAGYYSGTGKL